MFRVVKAPLEPKYATDLDALHFKIDNGRFVSKDAKFKYFDFHDTDNVRVNEIRQEAMHEAVRKEVFERLAKYDIVPLYAEGRTFGQVTEQKPDGPHVQIVGTKPGLLRNKHEVVVVVGEGITGTQDAGIWAYRVLLRAGGLEHGSAVGLAARLAAHGRGGNVKDPIAEGEEDELGSEHVSADERRKQEEKTPGLMILNPGQLLYSYKENKAKSRVSWNARPRSSAIELEDDIDTELNYVRGHRSSEEHIMTCLEHVLPKLIPEACRVHIIAIGDSCQNVVSCLDELFIQRSSSYISLAAMLDQVAFVQPSIDANSVVSEILKISLARRGKSFVMSVVPRGTLVNTYPSFTPSGSDAYQRVPNLDDQEEDDEDDALYTYSRRQSGDTQVDTGSNRTSCHDSSDEPRSSSCGELNFLEPAGVVPSARESAAIDASWTKLKPENDSEAAAGVDEVTEDLADITAQAMAEHAREKTLCPVFSAGECDGILECVLPTVLPDILDRFFNAWETHGEK